LDEQKPVNDENVEPVSDEPRKGDVLGLSGSDVPKTGIDTGSGGAGADGAEE